jgi:mRNA interferase RelE/StbE
MARRNLLIEPEAHAARKRLPGHVRQRLRRAIESLADDPRGRQSSALDLSDIHVQPGIELRRLRVEQWRVIYAVNNGEGWVWVLAIRRRPPYEYEDLEDLTNPLR